MLAIVQSMNPRRENQVRSCTMGYRIPKRKEMMEQYSEKRCINLTQSIQGLTLLLQVEDQEDSLDVEVKQEVVPTILIK